MARGKGVLILSVALAVSPASAQLATEDDFSTWTLISVVGPPSATTTRIATGGNPDAHLQVATNTSGGGTAFGGGYDPAQSMGTSLAGLPFTLSLDVKDGAGAVGDGQGIALLIEQGGILYVTTITPSITNDGHAAFDTLNFTGSFAGFGRLDGMAGSPTLDGSVATRFGFVAGNTASSPLAMLYDNYSLVVDTPTSTPTSTPSPVTPSPTFTATNTATPVTPSPTSTATNTATPVTPSPTSTATNTATPVTPSATATATSTGTPTRTPTQTSIIEPPIAPEIPTLDGRALLILIAVLALLAVHRLRAG